LAQQLGKAYEGLKQGPSRTTIIWVGVIAAAVVGYLLFRYFMNTSEADASERWTTLDGVVFPEQLDTFLQKASNKDSPQARLASFKEARLKLASGLRDLGANRKDALERIDEATRLYESLARSAGKVPLLHQEALSGAAKGYETLGDTEKALSLYKRLADDYPTSALGKDAKKQVERLD